jgi:porin
VAQKQDALIRVRAGAVAFVFALNSTAVFADDGSPVSFEAVYTGESWTNARGGIKTGTRYIHNIDLTMEADLSFVGLKDTTLFLYGLHTNSPEFSADLVGDAQVVSSIDNSEVFRLEEAWIEKLFVDGVLSFKAGLIDLNADFDVNEAGGLFINSSHGIGVEIAQTGDNGPSIFPSTSLAARVQYAPNDNWSFRLGAFDETPNDPNNPKNQRVDWSKGTLLIGEATYLSEDGLRINAGGWGYTSEFQPILSADKVGKNMGGYALIEGPLYRESIDTDQGLNGFVRVGTANDRINQFSHYLGAGVVYTGPFKSRDEDQIGFAIAAAGNGRDFKRSIRMAGGTPEDYETNLELTYRAQLTDWLAIQPDVQYVINPGAVGGLRHALVLGVRLEIGYAF